MHWKYNELTTAVKMDKRDAEFVSIEEALCRVYSICGQVVLWTLKNPESFGWGAWSTVSYVWNLSARSSISTTFDVATSIRHGGGSGTPSHWPYIAPCGAARRVPVGTYGDDKWDCDVQFNAIVSLTPSICSTQPSRIRHRSRGLWHSRLVRCVL